MTDTLLYDVKMEVFAIFDYLTAATPLPKFLPYARFLLDADLSHTAKLLYTLLLDRATLSQKNNWIDERGFVYVIFLISALSAVLQCSAMSVKRSLKSLENAELIERRRDKSSAPSRIFVRIPSAQKCSLKSNNSVPYGRTKMFSYMEQKCSTNQRNKNNLTRTRTTHLSLSGIPDYTFKEGESL